MASFFHDGRPGRRPKGFGIVTVPGRGMLPAGRPDAGIARGFGRTTALYTAGRRRGKAMLAPPCAPDPKVFLRSPRTQLGAPLGNGVGRILGLAEAKPANRDELAASGLTRGSASGLQLDNAQVRASLLRRRSDRSRVRDLPTRSVWRWKMAEVPGFEPGDFWVLQSEIRL